MKYSILTIFMCLTILSDAQEEDQISKFSLELNYSPNYSYRILYYDATQSGFIVDARETHEGATYGHNFGLALKYQVSPIELGLGLQYAREGIQFTNVPLSTTNGSEPGIANSKIQYSYLELPIKLEYPIINTSVKLSGIVGFSPKYLIRNRSITVFKYESGEIDEFVTEDILTNPNKINFNTLLGLGTTFRIRENIQLNFESIFRYTLRSLGNTPIRQHNYSLGLHVGIEHKL